MKIIYTLIISLLYLNVNAETFYTDYNLIESNTEKYHEEYFNNDLYKVDTKNGYNNYEEITTNIGFFPINTISNYTYYDLNDFQEISSYSKEPFSKEDKIHNTNRIKKYSSISNIQLRSFISNAYLRGLNIYYQNKPIEFSYTYNNYNTNDYLSSNHKITIDLKKSYNLEDLSIELVLYDNTMSRISFMLDVCPGKCPPGNPYDYFDNELYRNKYTENYIIDFLDTNNFNNLLKDLSWIKSKDYASTYSVPYYKNSYYKYNYYLTSKKYLNIYTPEPLQGYKLDLNDQKDIYDYYKRDYITIDDIITNLNNIKIDSSLPLNEITTTYDEGKELLSINYNDYTFYKKVSIPKKKDNESGTIIEEPIISEQINEPNKENEIVQEKKEIKRITPTTTSSKKTTTKKVTKKVETTTKKVQAHPVLINNEVAKVECPKPKDNSLLLKFYSIFNSILLLIISIMCKHYIFKKKR